MEIGVGRFDVRIGQPRVQRHAGHFDREADEQQQERPPLRARDPTSIGVA